MVCWGCQGSRECWGQGGVKGLGSVEDLVGVRGVGV